MWWSMINDHQMSYWFIPAQLRHQHMINDQWLEWCLLVMTPSLALSWRTRVWHGHLGMGASITGGWLAGGWFHRITGEIITNKNCDWTTICGLDSATGIFTGIMIMDSVFQTRASEYEVAAIVELWCREQSQLPLLFSFKFKSLDGLLLKFPGQWGWLPLRAQESTGHDNDSDVASAPFQSLITSVEDWTSDLKGLWPASSAAVCSGLLNINEE